MERPERKQPRLPEYDYSAPGANFVTICTQDRRCILSDISVGTGVPDGPRKSGDAPSLPVGAGVLDGPQVHLTEIGQTVDETIRGIDEQYDYLSVDKYVIMPNHIHLLITISEGGPSRTPAPTNAVIPRLVSTLKRFSNRRSGEQLWQRSYYEHVIRNEADYREVWAYIDGNPGKWTEDDYFADS